MRNSRSLEAVDGAAPRVFAYRTLHLYEADLVASELEAVGIPFHRAEEAPTGVRFAMPAAPSAAPGLTFLVVVPGRDAERARALVESLPVSNDSAPGVWATGMDANVRKFFRSWAWLSLVAFVAIAVGSMATCFGG